LSKELEDHDAKRKQQTELTKEDIEFEKNWPLDLEEFFIVDQN